uniref:Expressed protein n=2 Tax=Schizophyllum commune (strain H4-8 / FGSC 9210) TaxID=578458 RepID=D8Q5Y8_SCHCM
MTREPSALTRAPSELMRAPSESLAPSSPAQEPRSAFSEYSSSVSHASMADRPRGWRASVLSTLGGTLGRASAAKETKEAPQQERSRSRSKGKERDESRGRLPHLSLGRASRPSSAHVEPYTVPATHAGHYARERRESASPSRWDDLRRAGSASPARQPMTPPPRWESPSPPRLQPLRMQSSRDSLHAPRGPRPLQPLRRVPSNQDQSPL